MVPIKVIQRSKLEKARQALMVTGEVDLSIGAPLPIQQNSSLNEGNNQPTVGRKKRENWLSHETVGNFPSGTTHFPRLTSTYAKEFNIPSSINDLTEDRNKSLNIAVFIEAQNWRSNRSDKDESPLHLNQINEPPGSSESPMETGSCEVSSHETCQ